MKALVPASLTAALFAVSTAAAAPQVCQFGPQIEVLGVVASVQQAPAAPFDGIAVGDAFALDLNFAGDVICSSGHGNSGHIATAPCCEMTVGAANGSLDPFLADPCVWGEQAIFTPTYFVESVVADLPFASGAVRAVLELEDSQNLVGIELYQIIQDTIFVPSETAPGFAARLTLQDPSGTELAVIDLLEVGGDPGLSMNNYCTANPNSTGLSAFMAFDGSIAVADNDAELFAFNLPPDTFSFFLVSDTQGFIPNVAGSAGNLCVLGGIGRYVGPGQIQNSGPLGEVSLGIDLNSVPKPNGSVSTLPGMTWNFTAWFRDVTPSGTNTSNFADGLTLTFQ